MSQTSSTTSGAPTSEFPSCEDLQVLVGHEVEEHGVQRLRPGHAGAPRSSASRSARPWASREVAVVLAVDEQQVHADRRRRALQHVGHAEQQRHARAAVVGAGDRLGGVRRRRGRRRSGGCPSAPGTAAASSAPGRNRAMKLVSGSESPAAVTWVQRWVMTVSARCAQQAVEPAAGRRCASVPGIRGPKPTWVSIYRKADAPSNSRTCGARVAAGGEEQDGEQDEWRRMGRMKSRLGKQSQRGHVRAVSDSLPRRARAGTRR